MDKETRVKKARKRYVNLKKHKHPNASFGELWDEAKRKYPD
jgi:hypothetical protein